MLIVKTLADRLEATAAHLGMTTDDVLAALLYEMPDMHLLGLREVAGAVDFPVADELAAVMADMAPDLGLTPLGLSYAMSRILDRVIAMESAGERPVRRA